MNRENRSLIIALVTGAILIPIIPYLVLDWPWWVTLLIIIVLLGAVTMVIRQLGVEALRSWRPESPPTERLTPVTPAARPAPTAPAPAAPAASAAPSAPSVPVTRAAPATPSAPTGQFELVDIPLASSDGDYRFFFSGRVSWRQLSNIQEWSNTNPAALAAESILERAAEVTIRHDPSDCPLTQHRLAASLGVPARHRSGQVEAWVSDVALTLRAEDSQRLARMAEFLEKERQWEQERALERSIRTYLTDDVLANPASAVVWWLSRHTDQVEEAVRLYDTFTRLCAVAHSTEPPAGQERQPAANLASGLVRRLYPRADDAPQRAMFAEQFAKLIGSHGRHDIADRLRAEAGVPTVSSTGEPIAHDERAR